MFQLIKIYIIKCVDYALIYEILLYLQEISSKTIRM